MTETKELLQKPLQKTRRKVQKLKEVKSWPVLERDKKLLLKKPKGNAENTFYYIWMPKAAKSLSHNITTAKVHQIFQNLS